MAIAPNNLAPEEIEAKNEDTYEYLLSLIEDTQGQMALIIAACDSMAQRERIIKHYEADAWEEEKVRPFRIRLGQEPSLRAGLAALEEAHPYLKEAGKAVVSVTGAELLLRVKITGDEKQTELEKFYGYLQWTREALRAFQYPVVLWVSREILRELSRRAPDFWSWRKAVLRFEDESIEEVSAQLEPSQSRDERTEFQVGVVIGIKVGLPDREAELPPLEGLLEEIAALEMREPESYGLATLHHKLGQVYAQRVRRGKATAAAESEKTIKAFQQAIECYQAQGNLDAMATALNRLAGFYNGQSQFDQALKTAQSALDAARQADNSLEEMIALRRMGNAQLSLGNFQKAINHYQQSQQVAQAIRDRKGKATALGNLGIAYSSLGNFQKAIVFHSQSLKIKQEIGDTQGISNSLGNLGITYSSLGDFQKAIDLHSQSLEIAKELGNQQGIADELNNLGNIYLSLEDFEQVIALCSASFEIQQEIGNPRGMAIALDNLGCVYYFLENFQKAIAFHSQSLEIRQNIGDKQGVANSLTNLGNAYNSQGDFHKAAAFQYQSLQIQQEIGDKQGIANSLNNLGHTSDSLGDFEKTIAFYSQSLEIRQELGDRSGEAESFFNLAISQAKLNDPWAAKQNFEQARVIYEALKLDPKVEECDEALYQINAIIAKSPRRAPAIVDVTPTPTSSEASKIDAEKTEAEKKPIAPYLTLPIWAWFLIGLGLVILLAWLFG